MCFIVISYAPIKELKGALAWNTLLNGGEKLFDEQFAGPECLRLRGKDLYISQKGELVKVTGKHTTHVARFGKPTGK